MGAQLQTPAMSYPAAATPTGMGFSPFQVMLTPSQQQMSSPFTTSLSSASSVPTFFNNTQSQQPFGQWSTASSQPMIQSTIQASFFQPQPQSSVQQTTPAQSFLSHSPNQQLLSVSTAQAQFLTPSPSQQLRSHSPQAQMQSLQTTMPNSAGFLLQNPMSAQVNMGLGANPTGMTALGQPSFLGTTTMQMQQQQMLQQQQALFGAAQMQPMAASRMGPGENMFGGQMYSQGSQWGAM
jgi:hypothetical protein